MEESTCSKSCELLTPRRLKELEIGHRNLQEEHQNLINKMKELEGKTNKLIKLNFRMHKALQDEFTSDERKCAGVGDE